MSELRTAVHLAAKGFPGGITALAGALTRPGGPVVDPQILRNQLVGNERHNLSIDRAERIVELCDSDDLAHAAAFMRGGVFVRIPVSALADREDLLAKFNELYAELGQLSQRFAEATADNEVDAQERHDLSLIGRRICDKVQELLGLTFQVYGGRGE